jgi:hypothetical protein
MDTGGFFFIASVLDVKLPLPIELTPSIHLDRADSSQIATIQESLWNFEHPNFPDPGRMYYEYDWIPIGGVSNIRSITEPIPEGKWRYYILAFSGPGNDVHELLKIMFVVPPYISAFASFRTTLPFGCGAVFSRGLDNSAHQSFYSGPIITQPSSLTMEDVRNIQETLKLYKGLDPIRHEGVTRAIEFHQAL